MTRPAKWTAARREQGPAAAGGCARVEHPRYHRASGQPDTGHPGGVRQILVDLSRRESVAPYLVTAAPDVATSTNLAGFINRVRVFSLAARGRDRGSGAEVWRRGRGAAHRTGHQRDESVPAARPARAGLGPVRSAAAAGGHGVRPVRAARAGRVHLLGVLRRAVHRGRHASGAAPRRRAARTSPPSPRRSGSNCPASRSSSWRFAPLADVRRAASHRGGGVVRVAPRPPCRPAAPRPERCRRAR